MDAANHNSRKRRRQGNGEESTEISVKTKTKKRFSNGPKQSDSPSSVSWTKRAKAPPRYTPSSAISAMKSGRLYPFHCFFSSMQLNGVGFRSFHDLPLHMVDEIDVKNHHLRIPGLIRDLRLLSEDCKLNARLLCVPLKRYLHSLRKFDSGEGADDDIDPQLRGNIFRDFGGVDVLIDIIMSTAPFLPGTKGADEKKPGALLRAKSLACEILIFLTVMLEDGSNVKELLIAREDFLIFLFRLLPFLKICLPAADLIEVILQSRREVFNLSIVPNLGDIVRSFGEVQLANFCRICAVTVSDLDMYESKSSLYQQNKQKRSKTFVPLRDINQEALLGIPELLPRLVNLAVKKPDLRRFPLLSTEVDAWMEWIEDEFEEAEDEEDEDDQSDYDPVEAFLAPFSAHITHHRPRNEYSNPRSRFVANSNTRRIQTRASAAAEAAVARANNYRPLDLRTYSTRSRGIAPEPTASSSASNVFRRGNSKTLTSNGMLGVPSTSNANSDLPELANFLSTPDGEWLLSTESDDDEDSDFDEPFMGGISEAASPNGTLKLQPSLRVCNELIQRVEVVYVLGLFLVGKYRKKVQRRLAELCLIPGLSEVFDHFQWICHPSPGDIDSARSRLRGHNPSCECSPEVALKIQFLRLIHSYCDHSDFKHLLLTRTEMLELNHYKESVYELDARRDFPDEKVMCRGEKGLLTKIVEVMMNEPNGSTFRFWLARAVESFLRGCTSYADQTFLINRGLLKHVAENIIDSNPRPKEILQSSFDLLGEIIKFNIVAFHKFDKILNENDPEATSQRFFQTMNRCLVDSNMFIRALVLSLENFLLHGAIQTDVIVGEYSLENNRLLMHIANFETQIDLLVSLIRLINVENLTQENVSCLNTTLVFLMFANRKSELPKYLAGLKAKSLTPANGSGSQSADYAGSTLLKNFRDLLLFWQEHYLHKDKDCSALERSSRIPFDYWKKTVLILINPDRSCELGLAHYLPPCDVPSEKIECSANLLKK